MTMTLCSEQTLVLKNKYAGNKASLDLLFRQQFVFGIVLTGLNFITSIGV